MALLPAQMSTSKGLVLDANILIRAVFGRRVREILERFEDRAPFFSPDVCFEDARRYIPDLCKRKRLIATVPLKVLDHVSRLVLPVGLDLYSEWEQEARQRIGHRDPNDWPVVAVSLLLNLPVWTEDQDFFGAGVATWTTRTVELYFLTAG